jgi:hypothetical protein
VFVNTCKVEITVLLCIIAIKYYVLIDLRGKYIYNFKVTVFKNVKQEHNVGIIFMDLYTVSFYSDKG